MVANYLAVLSAIALMTNAADAAPDARIAQTPAQPIRYTLAFPAPQTHYVEVSAVVPTSGRPEIELMMAVWTPGSYLIREYERQVESVTAVGANGRAIEVIKSEKNRWRMATGGAATVEVRYRVYAREMSVRTNWVEAGFAMLNGAPTFLTLADRAPRPYEVTIVPAQGWARSISGLPETGAHRYRAPDWDTLMDSPIVVGNPAVHEFEVDGKRHYLVNEGEAGIFDGTRAAKDLEAVVREHRRMWGSLPYDKYIFFNMLTLTSGNAGGGLEHKNSSMLMDWRFATRSRQPYLSWLDLASHEFFHVWNVKRLRPVELGPFDYERENHTRSLWIAEGITKYYGALALHRAGLSSLEEYLQSLSNQIEELQGGPGRLVQPVDAASFDAWIRYYRPDENSANVAVSYYTKGAVLGFLLDARIRKATGGARSLDDVMREAYQKYSGPKGYTPEEFRRVAEGVAGGDLKDFWDTAVQGTSELDYTEALQTFGLRFRPAAPSPGGGKAWLGAATRNGAGRLVVSQVRRGTPAHAAGLNVDDEILAIGEFRVRADRLDSRLEQYRPDEKVSVLVARREELLRIEVTLGAEPPKPWRLEPVPGATESQTRQLTKWLNV